jgi:hypothetical protein
MVYLLYCEGMYKIGITRDLLRRRVRTLKCGNWQNIQVADCYRSCYYQQVERALHRRLAADRHRGEWFELSDGQAGRFQTLCRDIETGLLALESEDERRLRKAEQLRQ